MNLALNGIQDILDGSAGLFKKHIKGATLRRRTTGMKLAIMYKEVRAYKKLGIHITMARYVEDMVIISGSRRLLSIIKVKLQTFLKERGLQIHPLKSKIRQFLVAQPFHFLGYTFNRLVQTKHIRHKALRKGGKVFRLLNNKPRLYVYPSMESLRKIRRKLTLLFRTNTNTTAFELISRLNPLLRTWYNYFRFSNCAGA